MLLIEYVGHIGLRSLTDGHLGRHLEYFKTLNDARVASDGFIKYNASTTRINKEKNFKIKFQVNLVFYWTIMSDCVLNKYTFLILLINRISLLESSKDKDTVSSMTTMMAISKAKFQLFSHSNVETALGNTDL